MNIAEVLEFIDNELAICPKCRLLTPTTGFGFGKDCPACSRVHIINYVKGFNWRDSMCLVCFDKYRKDLFIEAKKLDSLKSFRLSIYGSLDI